MATPTLQPLTENERAMFPGYTHSYVIDVTLGHVTTAATNTAQTFTAFTTKDQDRIAKVGVVLTEKFQNTADAAFNSDALVVGITGTTNAFITTMELNANGSVVDAGYSTGSSLPYTATSAVAVLVTLASMSGKSLSNLNAGRVVVLFDLFRIDPALKLRATGNETIIPS